MLKPSRWDRLAVAMIRIVGAGALLFLALAVLLDWSCVFRPDLHDTLLLRLFGVGCVYLDRSDDGLDQAIIWYPAVAGIAAMVAVGVITGRRERRFVGASLWCLCSTAAMSAMLFGWYRAGLGYAMSRDTLISTVWPIYLLACGAGWAVTFRPRPRPVVPAEVPDE